MFEGRLPARASGEVQHRHLNAHDLIINLVIIVPIINLNIDLVIGMPNDALDTLDVMPTKVEEVKVTALDKELVALIVDVVVDVVVGVLVVVHVDRQEDAAEILRKDKGEEKRRKTKSRREK